MDYDKILVLSKGQVSEYASPFELIQQEQGLFRDMCQESGELDDLYEIARVRNEELKQ